MPVGDICTDGAVLEYIAVRPRPMVPKLVPLGLSDDPELLDASAELLLDSVASEDDGGVTPTGLLDGPGDEVDGGRVDARDDADEVAAGLIEIRSGLQEGLHR